MQSHVVVALATVAFAACDDRRREQVAVDAAPDVSAPIDDSRMPFSASGTTPAGSLADIHFIEVGYLNGFCPSGYYIDLYRTNIVHDVAAVHFHVPIDEAMQPPTGTLAARAYLSGGLPETDQVTFEVVHVDVPPTPSLRIAGRMRASSGEWSFDFSLDAQTTAIVCI